MSHDRNLPTDAALLAMENLLALPFVVEELADGTVVAGEANATIFTVLLDLLNVLALEALDHGSGKAIKLVRLLDVPLVQVLCVVVAESASEELTALFAALLASSTVVRAPVQHTRCHDLLCLFFACRLLDCLLGSNWFLLFFTFLLVFPFLLAVFLVLPIVFAGLLSILSLILLRPLLFRSLFLRSVVLWRPLRRIYIAVRVSENVRVVLDSGEARLEITHCSILQDY